MANLCVHCALILYEPFGLGRFATDRCYAPHVTGRYAALLLTKPLILYVSKYLLWLYTFLSTILNFY